MPLPLVPVIIVLGSTVLAALGIGAGRRGKARFAEAKAKSAEAKTLHDSATKELEERRLLLVGQASRYHDLVLELKNTTFQRAAEVLDRFGGQRGQRGYQSLADIEISPEEFAHYQQSIAVPATLLEGCAKGIAMGAMAGQSAITAISLVGTASTGASIAGLSGAAASSATLAWLGGGAIAAGGGGIAVGSIVLGGVAIGPALAVGGWVVGAKGERALTEASLYVSRVNQAIECLDTAGKVLENVSAQVDERSALLVQLNARALTELDNISPAGETLERSSDAIALHQSMLLVKAMSEIMLAPVLDAETGELDAIGISLVAKYRALVE